MFGFMDAFYVGCFAVYYGLWRVFGSLVFLVALIGSC